MMAISSLLERARRLMETPTAPFREGWMLEALDGLLDEIPGLEVQADRFGNRLARLRRGGPTPAPPAIFVAHVDHPGFVFGGAAEEDGVAGGLERGAAEEGVGEAREAEFDGHVLDEYFAGAGVRLFRSAGDAGVRGRVVSAGARGGENRTRRVRLELEGGMDARGARLGMWDVEAFRVEGDWLWGRACDDLLGCAAIVEGLSRLAAEGRSDLDVGAIFTRGEEAGFCGALALVDERTWSALLPAGGLFVSVEISGEIAGRVEPGGGAIVRAGDLRTTFDGAVTDGLVELARGKGIAARRALMDRGTCEGSVFAREGLRACGLCIALRNYHNMDLVSGRIAAEGVALGDLEALAGLIAETGRAACAGGLGAGRAALEGREELLLKAFRRLAEG